jgi:hypothetical protein
LTQSACHDADVPERPDSDREVLTSLPRSRPVRRSAKRAARPAPDGAARAADKVVAPRKPRAARAAVKPGAPAKPAAAGRVARPRATAKPAPNPEPATARTRVPPQRKIPAAGYAAPDARAGDPAGSAAAELISTTIQAAAELAQIGMTVGRQTLQSMLDRLPKP